MNGSAIRASRALTCAMERGDRPFRRRPTSPLRCAPIRALLTKLSSIRECRPRNGRTVPRHSPLPITGRCRASLIGPSCAVADVTSEDTATIGPRRKARTEIRTTFARFIGLPKDKVRLIYLEGSGCYGMNGHEDAAADAAILSRATGRPVRVQWTREDEPGLGSRRARRS